MLSYSAITNSGKVTLPSVGSWGTNMNIMKDPPKSIMMRRIDKVGDTNEITKMIDNSDRSAESILRFARGVNPSVSVNYSNFGGSQQNFGNQQAFLPYTINKDGDFHPPVQAPQDLLPLSRMPRNTTFAISNPGMPHNTKELSNSRNVNAARNVHEKIVSSQVRSTKTYLLQKPFQEPFVHTKSSIQEIAHKKATPNISSMNRHTELFVQYPTKGINENYTTVSAQPNLQEVKHQTLNEENFNSDKYIQDTNAHSVYSNIGSYVDNGVFLDEDMLDLNDLKTKDTNSINYTTTLSGIEKTNHIYENFELLDRNLPEYEAHSNLMGDSKKVSFIHDDLELERNLPEYQTRTNTNGIRKNVNFIHKDLELERNLPEHQTRTNTNGSRKDTNFIHKDIELERNLPEHQTRTNSNGTRKNVNFIHKDIELERNLPEYQTKTNIIGNAKVSFIHKNIELERNLPEYQTNTNIKYNTQKNIKPEYIRENERKTVATNFFANENKIGESNISSRDYYLEERRQRGGFENSGSIPTFERKQNEMRIAETEKSLMSKNVMNQFQQRYSR